MISEESAFFSQNQLASGNKRDRMNKTQFEIRIRQILGSASSISTLTPAMASPSVQSTGEVPGNATYPY